MALRADFHTHTILSDGDLLPLELIATAATMGLGTIAITDHVSLANMSDVIEKIRAEVEAAESYGIRALTGVELTYIPPELIGRAARKAREMGAQVVVVHGETIAEKVPEGTNMAAARSPDVDILAHPGLIDTDTCVEAARNDVFLEISSRRGHSLTNGRVVAYGRKAGAKFLVNTDTHARIDIMDMNGAKRVGLGSGLNEEEVRAALIESPKILLERIDSRL